MNNQIITGITLVRMILLLANNSLLAQNPTDDPTYKKFYLGSSLFMLANLNTKDVNAPDFVQLNFGYRITPKDMISIEVKT